jgi:GTP-binding protein HflX
VQRQKRIQAKIPQVCLVGYTNAGKSTLLNALTGAEQVVLDSLFTTLDTTSRSLTLENGQRIVISDTVGFLHKLPHHLIEAFKATLESVTEADLLLHILDISDALFREHAHAVGDVLKELKSDEKPTITVLNKIDKLEDKDWIERYKADFPNSVAISALKKENLDSLLEIIQQELKIGIVSTDLEIPINRMDLVDLIYREGRVNKIEYCEKVIKINANLSTNLLDKLKYY